MKYRESLMKFAQCEGVSWVSRRYNKPRSYSSSSAIGLSFPGLLFQEVSQAPQQP